MTASAALDGRIDWGGTFAALAVANPAAFQPNGTSAYTSDYGVVQVVGGAWRANTPLVISGGGSSPTLTRQQPLTGATYQVPNGVFSVDIEPAGTIAAYTIVFPQAPGDNQNLVLMFSQAITALTLTPGSGQTISNPPTAAVANGAFEFRYILASLAWRRIL